MAFHLLIELHCIFHVKGWIGLALVDIPEHKWTRRDVVFRDAPPSRNPPPSSNDDLIAWQNATFICPDGIGVILSIPVEELEERDTLEAGNSSLWWYSVHASEEMRIFVVVLAATEERLHRITFWLHFWIPNTASKTPFDMSRVVRPCFVVLFKALWPSKFGLVEDHGDILKMELVIFLYDKAATYLKWANMINEYILKCTTASVFVSKSAEEILIHVCYSRLVKAIIGIRIVSLL